MLNIKKQSIISLRKLLKNETQSYKLDSKSDWTEDILTDLNLISEEDEDEKGEKKSHLQVNFNIVRSVAASLAEHIRIKGMFQLKYPTHCVRCNKVMEESLDRDFHFCLLSPEFESSEEYSKLTEIFDEEGREMDLYFYKNLSFDLKDLLHEKIALELNPFPLHSDDCKGLCQICGQDLNWALCEHQITLSKKENT